MYIHARGWPGINLGASHECCAHPNVYEFMRGHREGGPTGFTKKSKMPFFLEIFKNPFKRLLQ